MVLAAAVGLSTSWGCATTFGCSETRVSLSRPQRVEACDTEEGTPSEGNPDTQCLLTSFFQLQHPTGAKSDMLVVESARGMCCKDTASKHLQQASGHVVLCSSGLAVKSGRRFQTSNAIRLLDAQGHSAHAACAGHWISFLHCTGILRSG